MRARTTWLDGLKLIAAQLIVLHHIAAYGPLGDALHRAAPALWAWLFEYARMAVQVFLVLGGYLAARSLAPEGSLRISAPWRTVWQRYLRLALPFMAAMLLAIGAAALTRHALNDEFIPHPPTWGQLIAHGLLLHGVLKQESLSAGVWYVAIDFQLFALLTLLLCIGQRRALTLTLISLLTLASLFFFNRNPAWDDWGPYFLGAYGMGALACWVGSSRHPARLTGMLTLMGLAALALDFRTRIALALALSLGLALLQWRGQPLPGHQRIPAWLERSIHLLGRSSYALFLLHFPVLMLSNALLTRMNWHSDAAALALTLATLAVSLLMAVWFERWVEQPLTRLGKKQGAAAS